MPNYQVFTPISLLYLIFLMLPMLEPFEDVSVSQPCEARMHLSTEKGREILGREGNGIIVPGCAHNYSCAQVIAEIPDLEPIPSPGSCPERNWLDNLCGSYKSTISRM